MLTFNQLIPINKINTIFNTMKPNPFEYNQVNSYLWNRQGKRHYWGIRGKDYGFLQSPALKNTIDDQDPNLKLLKQHHAQYSLSPYEDKQALRLSDDLPRRSQQRYEDNNKYLRNQYISQHVSPKLRTEPINYEQQRQESSRLMHKKNLSLMSKNIEIKNQVHTKRFSTIDPNDKNKDVMPRIHRRVNTQGEINNINNQLNQYRERIVKVVKRDRKNNPTFCNSLAYPLHCHRYVE